MTMQSKNSPYGRALITALACLLLYGCPDQSATGVPVDWSARDKSVDSVPIELAEVTFSIPDMHCLLCPIAVRRELESVDGVHDAFATFSERTAVVRFDPSRTNLDELIVAIRRSGLSARVKAK